MDHNVFVVWHCQYQEYPTEPRNKQREEKKMNSSVFDARGRLHVLIVCCSGIIHDCHSVPTQNWAKWLSLQNLQSSFKGMEATANVATVTWRKGVMKGLQFFSVYRDPDYRAELNILDHGPEFFEVKSVSRDTFSLQVCHTGRRNPVYACTSTSRQNLQVKL